MWIQKALVGASFALLVACGVPLKYNMASTPKAPGADAHLVADVHDSQSLTQIEFESTNLAPPERVAEGSTQYVVWYRKTADKPWSRAGTLKYDADSRKGILQASVPETTFDFMVSAEQSGDPASPSVNIIFSQHVAK